MFFKYLTCSTECTHIMQLTLCWMEVNQLITLPSIFCGCLLIKWEHSCSTYTYTHLHTHTHTHTLSLFSPCIMCCYCAESAKDICMASARNCFNWKRNNTKMKAQYRALVKTKMSEFCFQSTVKQNKHCTDIYYTFFSSLKHSSFSCTITITRQATAQ